MVSRLKSAALVGYAGYVSPPTDIHKVTDPPPNLHGVALELISTTEGRDKNTPSKHTQLIQPGQQTSTEKPSPDPKYWKNNSTRDESVKFNGYEANLPVIAPIMENGTIKAAVVRHTTSIIESMAKLDWNWKKKCSTKDSTRQHISRRIWPRFAWNIWMTTWTRHIKTPTSSSLTRILTRYLRNHST
jgi:hypothetical protein